MTTKLYEIWWHFSGKSFPMVDLLSVTTYTRDQVISTDKTKLDVLCERLNALAGTDECFDVGERPIPDYLRPFLQE